MRQITTACLVSLALGASAAETSGFPPGYWDRMYGMGTQSGSYTIVMQVDDIGKTEADIDRRMSKAGATLTSLNNGYGFYNNRSNQHSKMIVYAMDSGRAESAAKSLFNLGQLQQFTNQRQIENSQLDEIKQKIKQLNAEIEGNSDALKRMPIASYFLNAQLVRLSQARDSYETALKKMTINITLVETASSTK